jgi:acyl carrier protein
MLTRPTRDAIEVLIHDKIRALLSRRAPRSRAISGTANLNAELGLTSLDLAFLVAELEAELGVDPFAQRASITSVRTVNDLVNAYHDAGVLPDTREAPVRSNAPDPVRRNENNKVSPFSRR